jgi:uncharacterized membrane protein
MKQSWIEMLLKTFQRANKKKGYDSTREYKKKHILVLVKTFWYFVTIFFYCLVSKIDCYYEIFIALPIWEMYQIEVIKLFEMTNIEYYPFPQ